MQKAFWEQSRWLSMGSLIALRHDGKNMCFVEITGRDADDLARSNTRAHVTVAFLNADDRRAVLTALANTHAVRPNDQTGWRTAESVAAAQEANNPDLMQIVQVGFHDAVQVSNNFGVSRPVLQALQSGCLADPPFQDVLFTQKHGEEQQQLAPPPWEADVRTRQWMQPQLDKMDAAQRAAFDVSLVQPVSLIQGPPGA